MRKINKPTQLCVDVFSQCISKVKNKAHKILLTDATVFVEDASVEFNNKVTTGALHTIPTLYCGDGGLSVNALEKVYTGRMVPENSPGRNIYDILLQSADLGTCPMCGHRDVSELDHYLPKSKYPLLCASPLNLIPCCSDCNGLKDDKYPTTDEEEFIHPYYDDVEEEQWLWAKIIQTSPCSFHFYIEPPADWPDLLKRRLEYHFRKLKLGKLYSAQAGRENSRIRAALEKRLKTGPHMVREYLEEEYETSNEYNINSWQAVLYQAAAKDAWYLSGGFR